MHNDGRVVSNFIVQALRDQPLTVYVFFLADASTARPLLCRCFMLCRYGEGKQTRSFCFVSDLVDGLIRLMNTENITGLSHYLSSFAHCQHSGAPSSVLTAFLTGPVNLGNPVENTILELAEQVWPERSGSSGHQRLRSLR